MKNTLLFSFFSVLFFSACGTNGSGPVDTDVETGQDFISEDFIEVVPEVVPDISDPRPEEFTEEIVEITTEDIATEIETSDCVPLPGDPEVFDMEGTAQDMDWIAAEYGSVYERAPMDRICSAGGVYRFTEFREREGPSNIDVWVFDESGSPMASLPVAFYWPDAPETSREDEWYPVKLTENTNAEGRVGFALGGGSYHGPGEGGPHAIWVSDENYPSDLADRLGMLVGTNHRHLDLTFVFISAE